MMMTDNDIFETCGGQTWDVAIVGAGPAGALAARQCAGMGLSVLLLDKASFPRYKVCGSCLNARTLGLLDMVGLHDLPGRLGARPLESLVLQAGGRPATLSLPDSAVLSREALDMGLIAAAQAAGAYFLPETHVTEQREERLAEETLVRPLLLRRGVVETTIEARVVVAANGLGSALFSRQEDTCWEISEHSRVGAGAIIDQAPDFYQPGNIYMACGWKGYVGLVRLEDGRLDVAAALDPGWIKKARGIGFAVHLILHEAGFPEIEGLPEIDWRGTPPLTRRRRGVATHRGLIIGDAAGYVEPFTGEGIAWALASAVAAAPIIRQGVDGWSRNVERAWEKAYHHTVVKQQILSRMVAGILRRPALYTKIIYLLSIKPSLGRPLLNLLNGPKPQRRTVAEKAIHS